MKAFRGALLVLALLASCGPPKEAKQPKEIDADTAMQIAWKCLRADGDLEDFDFNKFRQWYEPIPVGDEHFTVAHNCGMVDASGEKHPWPCGVGAEIDRKTSKCTPALIN